MNKVTIGLLFITVGLLYSLTAWDTFYNNTLGILIKHDYIRLPHLNSNKPSKLGRKANILLYGFALIGIGIYLIFLSNL